MKKTLLLFFFFAVTNIFAQNPIAYPISQATLDYFKRCDFIWWDGPFEEFDLTFVEYDVLGTQTSLSISYHLNPTDQASGNNSIINPTTFGNTSNPQIIYVRVTDGNGNFDTTNFMLIVESVPQPSITSNTGSNIICIDNSTGNLVSGLTLDSGLSSSSNYTYQWSLNGIAILGATNATYEITTVNPGDYSVNATSSGSLGCLGSTSFTVVQSSTCSLQTNTFKETNITMYPNPAKNQVTISLDNTNEIIEKISVVDILGKQVIQLNKVNKSIDLSSLNTGIYFIEIEKQNKLVVKRKLIVN